MTTIIAFICVLLLLTLALPTHAQFALNKKRKAEEERPLTGFEKQQQQALKRDRGKKPRTYESGGRARRGGGGAAATAAPGGGGVAAGAGAIPTQAEIMEMVEAFGLTPEMMAEAGLDASSIQAMVSEMMENPQLMEQQMAAAMEMLGEDGLSNLGGLGDLDLSALGDLDLSSVMDEFNNMGGADGIVDEMKSMWEKQILEIEGMNKQELMEFMDTMASSGMVEEDQLAAWKKNPKKMVKELKQQIREMEKMMNSPEMKAQIAETTESIVEMFSNPEKMEAAINEIVKELEEWDTDLSGSDKLETARKMLLESGGNENTPSLKKAIGDQDMQKILNSKNLFEQTIEKRQRGRRGGIAADL